MSVISAVSKNMSVCVHTSGGRAALGDSLGDDTPPQETIFSILGRRYVPRILILLQYVVDPFWILVSPNTHGMNRGYYNACRDPPSDGPGAMV